MILFLVASAARQKTRSHRTDLRSTQNHVGGMRGGGRGGRGDNMKLWHYTLEKRKWNCSNMMPIIRIQQISGFLWFFYESFKSVEFGFHVVLVNACHINRACVNRLHWSKTTPPTVTDFFSVHSNHKRWWQNKITCR